MAQDLTKGRPFPTLLKFTLPVIGGNLFQLFYTLADTMIVGGTSLSVYPAASLLEFFMGKHLILINKTETPYDRRADLILRQPIGQVLGEAVPQ